MVLGICCCCPKSEIIKNENISPKISEPSKPEEDVVFTIPVLSEEPITIQPTRREPTRPLSDTKIYEIKKADQTWKDGYNNFAFVDEIDSKTSSVKQEKVQENSKVNNYKSQEALRIEDTKKKLEGITPNVDNNALAITKRKSGNRSESSSDHDSNDEPSKDNFYVITNNICTLTTYENGQKITKTIKADDLNFDHAKFSQEMQNMASNLKQTFGNWKHEHFPHQIKLDNNVENIKKELEARNNIHRTNYGTNIKIDNGGIIINGKRVTSTNYTDYNLVITNDLAGTHIKIGNKVNNNGANYSNNLVFNPTISPQFNNNVYVKDEKTIQSHSDNEHKNLTYEDFRKIILDKSFDRFIEDAGVKQHADDIHFEKPFQNVYENKTNPPEEKQEAEQKNSITGTKRKPPVLEVDNTKKSIKTSSSVDIKNMRLSCLEAHNRMRSLHGCPPLRESEELSKIAQDWANHLSIHSTDSKRVYGSPDSKYSESLYWTNDENAHVVTAVQSWYDEIKLYDFNNPGYNPKSSHFTQIIWKDTLELGTGVARVGKNLWIVCNYNPPGNYKGEFNDYSVPRQVSYTELSNSLIQRNLKYIRESCLKIHNYYRTLHGCPPLRQSKELNKYAEETANQIIANNGEIKRTKSDFGENLFWTTAPFGHVTLAVQRWYDGATSYDFNKPGFGQSSANFTQLIWRDKLYLGTAVTKINEKIWVVCHYNPPGNYSGRFNDYHVPRLISDKLHKTIDKDLVNMRLSCLEAHNRLRALHGCPPLRENNELNILADDWARHLAENNYQLYHRPNNKYGENLYWTTDKYGHVTMGVQDWYDEIELYDYNNPGFAKATGHFTQLIWRDTVEVGTAIARRGDELYLVCNYNPPGNVNGRFTDYYVPRPKN